MRAPSEDSPILRELDGWEEGSYPPNQLWEPLAKWWHRCIHQSDPFLSGWNTNVFVHRALRSLKEKWFYLYSLWSLCTGIIFSVGHMSFAHIYEAGEKAFNEFQECVWL